MARYTPLSHYRRESSVPQRFPVPCPDCRLPVEGSTQHSAPSITIGWLSPYMAVARSGYWELRSCQPCERCGWEMPAGEAERLTEIIAAELAGGNDRRE